MFHKAIIIAATVTHLGYIYDLGAKSLPIKYLDIYPLFQYQYCIQILKYVSYSRICWQGLVKFECSDYSFMTKSTYSNCLNANMDY